MINRFFFLAVFQKPVTSSANTPRKLKSSRTNTLQGTKLNGAISQALLGLLILIQCAIDGLSLHLE